MTDAGEIAQVVAPSAVAVAAIIFASRQQLRAYRFDRHLADRAELRELLDESTQALTKARGFTGALATGFLAHGKHLPTAAKGTVDRFMEVGRAIELQQDQLSIRLGTSAPIVAVHREAHAVALEVLEVVHSLEHDPDAPLREIGERLERGRGLINDARDTFVAAAVEIIGVEPAPAARTARVRLVRGDRQT